MMGSMYSAVSGLRNHQLFMEVVGNNIANVSTLGYKGSRIVFQDIMSRILRGPSAGTDTQGGANPIQIGLGATLAATTGQFEQGTLYATGKATDLAIQGAGFFVVSDGDANYFTRAGAFDIDSQGRLVDPATGLLVQGWQADASGNVDTTQRLGAITVPLNQAATAQPTMNAVLGGNLNAEAAAGDSTTLTVTVFDSLGIAHDITLTFTKSANNTWNWAAAADPSDTAITAITASPSSTSFVFTADGQFDKANNTTQWDPSTDTPLSNFSITYGNGAAAQTVTLDLSNLTQLANSGSQTGVGNLVARQDGSGQGTLTSISIGPNGEVVGIYSNGQSEVVGQLALAAFANEQGLIRLGNTMFAASPASGDPQIGPAGSNGLGSVNAGFLEQSNVDLAQEFTNLIMAERGFQANSRVITASDEMLQDLVNLKR